MAQRLLQPAGLVRLRLRPQVRPLAQPQGQQHRGAGQLLQDGGVQAPDPRRRQEQADAAGQGVTAANAQSGKASMRNVDIGYTGSISVHLTRHSTPLKCRNI